jgi:hypothetical protein
MRINGQPPTRSAIVALGVTYYRQHETVPLHSALTNAHGLPPYREVRRFFPSMRAYQLAILQAVDAQGTREQAQRLPLTRRRLTRRGRAVVSDAWEWTSANLTADLLTPTFPPHPAGRCTCRGGCASCPACQRCPHGMPPHEAAHYLGNVS